MRVTQAALIRRQRGALSHTVNSDAELLTFDTFSGRQIWKGQNRAVGDTL